MWISAIPFVARKVRTRAKGLAWEAIKVDLFKIDNTIPNYLQLYPKGVDIG
jgi:hypothetical protein